jgi:hypothetical protein
VLGTGCGWNDRLRSQLVMLWMRSGRASVLPETRPECHLECRRRLHACMHAICKSPIHTPRVAGHFTTTSSTCPERKKDRTVSASLGFSTDAQPPTRQRAGSNPGAFLFSLVACMLGCSDALAVSTNSSMVVKAVSESGLLSGRLLSVTLGGGGVLFGVGACGC